jgi:hypothetical protein
MYINIYIYIYVFVPMILLDFEAYKNLFSLTWGYLLTNFSFNKLILLIVLHFLIP